MKKQSKIKIPMDKIEFFCRKWKIKEFSLFGSVLRDDFRSDSDIDVLVSFEENAGWDLFDIVEKGAIRNPYRRQSIMTHREVLYAA